MPCYLICKGKTFKGERYDDIEYTLGVFTSYENALEACIKYNLAALGGDEDKREVANMLAKSERPAVGFYNIVTAQLFHKEK